MAEIGFYHLTRTGPDAALPPLLGRTLAAGQRALLLCGSADRVATVDAALWASTSPEWLPHGTPADGQPGWQPIWITTLAELGGAAAPNGARFLFLTDGVDAPDHHGFDRVFDLFDGTDPAAVSAARLRWTRAKADGHSLTYWRQTPQGWARGGG